MYFNVNFNVFFKLIKVHLLVSELHIYQNARFNDKNHHLACFLSMPLSSHGIFRQFFNKIYFRAAFETKAPR